MDSQNVRTLWHNVSIAGYIIAFLGTGLGLLGYVMGSKVARQIERRAPLEAPITTAAAFLSMLRRQFSEADL